MSEASEHFDAYHKWLGIAPEEQPPNHYRLLSIGLFESDPDVIANAADKQMGHIRTFQTGAHSALSQKLLNEIATARVCLLNAAKKPEYDRKLHEEYDRQLHKRDKLGAKPALEARPWAKFETEGDGSEYPIEPSPKSSQPSVPEVSVPARGPITLADALMDKLGWSSGVSGKAPSPVTAASVESDFTFLDDAIGQPKSSSGQAHNPDSLDPELAAVLVTRGTSTSRGADRKIQPKPAVLNAKHEEQAKPVVRDWKILTSFAAVCGLLAVALVIGISLWLSRKVKDEPTIPAPLPNPFLADGPIRGSLWIPPNLSRIKQELVLPPPVPWVNVEEYYDDSSVFEHKGGGMMAASDQPNLGGLGGFDVKAIGPGPMDRSEGGVGVGDGWGFGGRGSGSRKAQLASGGGTRQSERAVAAALFWLAKHQSPNGSWSLAGYKARCKDATCTGPGNGNHDSGATAMGLLPFLAAGQTHESKGPYQRNIQAGVYWLLGAQKPNGDLRAGSTMYSHGLASIALCECYGMTGDKRVGQAAQMALNFIMASQDKRGGGWRYSPGETGDTSVIGWQIMALKSGQMAYLNVNPAVFEKAKEFLRSASSGPYGGQFSYMPGGDGTTAMTGVGLLCSQYLKTQKDDPTMVAGKDFLMKNMPDSGVRNLYYWYYATQVMHNIQGPDWDTWNRKMRRVLIDTQAKEGCASGSWDPKAPAVDQWGSVGGRVMMTSLSALTLEVYYRYLPLYKLDKPDEPAAGLPRWQPPSQIRKTTTNLSSYK